MTLKVLYFSRKFAAKTTLVRVFDRAPLLREMWLKLPMRGAAVWGFFERSIWHHQPANFAGPTQIQRGANRLDLASFPKRQHHKMNVGIIFPVKRVAYQSFFNRAPLRTNG
jgi:hypothetical protein